MKYASKFQQISSRLKWENVALTEMFYIRLKKIVKDEISWMKRSDELSEMIEIAIRINNQMYERQMKRNKDRNVSFQSWYKANSDKIKKSYLRTYFREMDLNATQHKQQSYKKNGKFWSRKRELSPA